MGSWRAGSGPQQTELIAQEGHVVQRGSFSPGPLGPLGGSVYECPGILEAFQGRQPEFGFPSTILQFPGLSLGNLI